jgi:hypothetical protein
MAIGAHDDAGGCLIVRRGVAYDLIDADRLRRAGAAGLEPR